MVVVGTLHVHVKEGRRRGIKAGSRPIRKLSLRVVPRLGRDRGDEIETIINTVVVGTSI